MSPSLAAKQLLAGAGILAVAGAMIATGLELKGNKWGYSVYGNSILHRHKPFHRQGLEKGSVSMCGDATKITARNYDGVILTAYKEPASARHNLRRPLDADFDDLDLA